VVLKIINKATVVNRDCLKTEPEILGSLPPHPNVVKFIASYDSDEHLILVLELYVCRHSLAIHRLRRRY